MGAALFATSPDRHILRLRATVGTALLHRPDPVATSGAISKGIAMPESRPQPSRIPDLPTLREAARRYLAAHPEVARDAGLSIGERLRRKFAERTTAPAQGGQS